MRPPTHSEEESPAVSAPARLLEGVHLLGAIAGTGAVFAALAFGIGYLAIKQQDVTLGLFTTTSYTSFVRAGAMFFPRAIEALVDFLAPYAWLIPAAALLTAMSILLVRRPLGSLRDLLRYQDVQAFALFVITSALVLVVLLYIPVFLAPFHPINRALLVQPYEERNPEAAGGLRETLGSIVGTKSNRLRKQDSTGSSAAQAGLQQIIENERRSRSHRFASRVYDELHNRDAETLLRVRFGGYCAAVIGLCVVSLLLRRWLHRIESRIQGRSWEETRWGANTTRRWIWAVRWGLRPVLLVLIVFFAMTVPSVYGVVGMSYSFPCVSHVEAGVVHTTGSEVSRLLSDLSGDVNEVVLYHWIETRAGSEDTARQVDDRLYALSLHKRQAISRVAGRRCGEQNILALKKPTRVDPTQVSPVVVIPIPDTNASRSPQADTTGPNTGNQQ